MSGAHNFSEKTIKAMEEMIAEGGPYAAAAQYQRDFSSDLLEMAMGHAGGPENFANAVALIAAHMATSAVMTVYGNQSIEANKSPLPVETVLWTFLGLIHNEVTKNIAKSDGGGGAVDYRTIQDGKVVKNAPTHLRN